MTDTPRIEPRPHWFDNDVLTADEMREALRLSERQWSRVAPTLPVSYHLGKQTPRYVYGEVVAVLKRTGAAA
ncbi:hypothetical protein [Humibacter sp.]|uniref:hypothetical protein n=1 Tax=Humibacter sp. TaxID=1940291 RepID=UPI003F802196